MSDRRPPTKTVCAGTVVIKDDTVLLVRQAKGHSLEGLWTIPWGIVESSEAPETAAVRETLEEAGVTAAVTGLLGYQNLESERGDSMALVFLCEHVSGEPEPDGRETDAAGYFTEDQVEELGDAVEVWCKWITLRVLRGDHSVITEASGHPYEPMKGFL